MALVRDLSDSTLSFQLEGGDVDQFRVVRYRGTEGVCQLYRFELELATDAATLAFDDIVGVGATLHVTTEFGERYFHGIVSRLELTGEGDDEIYCRVELVPALWLLTHRYASRIFQEKNTKDIITQVLTDSGLAADRFQFRGVARTQTREYCVQYRETDFNFICRLMEEEGIYWYFDQTPDAHVLVMADANDYPAIAGEAADVPFVPPAAMNVSTEHVFRFRLGQSIRPGAVVLRDFSFKHPPLNLETKGDSGRDAGLEFSDYPGEYEEQGVGTNLAKIRAEEFECMRITGVGASNSPRLAPGRTFELKKHTSDVLNQSYLVTSATYLGVAAARSTGTDAAGGAPGIDAHRGSNGWLYHAGQVSKDPATIANAGGQHPLDALTVRNLIEDVNVGTDENAAGSPYRCRFECVPATVMYRPARVTPWPVMRGTQTARVVGPSGEEIHTDEFGRVKVLFHWDREGEFDDKSSCWIRVSQGFAGGQYGMMFLPRVGQEVIVDFLEGDPDKPIIVGRVYNQDHMPAYKLPDEKTKSYIKTNSSTGGGGTNEIRFDDLAGKEQLLINSQKDYHVRVGHQERHNVAQNLFLTVNGEQRIRIGKHRSAAIGGKDATEVADEQSLVVQGDAYHQFDGNHDHVVASEYHIKADKVVVEAASGISLKVGGNFVVIDSSGVTIKGSMVKINSGGSALSSSISGSPASPAEPEDADEVAPGLDASYTGVPSERPPIEPKKIEGHWVSIDLKDDDGEPVAGEYFEIETPSGKVLHGTLDVNGSARRYVSEPGKCKITFPRMDAAEWDGA